MKTDSDSKQTESKPFDPRSLNLEQREAVLRDAADFLKNVSLVLKDQPELLATLLGKIQGKPPSSSEGEPSAKSQVAQPSSEPSQKKEV